MKLLTRLWEPPLTPGQRVTNIIIGGTLGLALAIGVHHYLGPGALGIFCLITAGIGHAQRKRYQARQEQQAEEHRVLVRANRDGELRERAAEEDRIIAKFRERFGPRVVEVRRVYDKISYGFSAMCYDITFEGRPEPERWYPQSDDEWLRVK